MALVCLHQMAPTEASEMRGLIDLSDSDRKSLSAAVARAKGIYRQGSSMHSIPTTKNTVLMTSCNSAYADFLSNWMCFANRHKLKFLFAPTDEAAARLLQPSAGPSLPACARSALDGDAVTIYRPTNYTGSFKLSARDSVFGTKDFFAITKHKLQMVLCILELGTHVWFSDVDVVFIRDPWPAFRHEYECDYEHQMNKCDLSDPLHYTYPPGGATIGRHFTDANTGFHKLLSNERTKGLVQKALALKGIDDQGALWKIILELGVWWTPKHHNTSTGGTIKPELFPSLQVAKTHVGLSYFVSAIDPPPVEVVAAHAGHNFTWCPLLEVTHPDGRQPTPNTTDEQRIIFHANFRMGRTKKRELLRQKHLWLLDKTSRSS